MAGERSDLGKIFITPGGDYDATVTYETLTMVKYNNSLYLTLRTVTGVTPSDDRVNYLLMAQGFTATRLESITATDVQGLVTEPGDEMPAQTLINAIADRVANQLVTNSALTDILGDYILKSAIANNLSITEEGKVLDARQGKALNDAIVTVNSNLSTLNDQFTLATGAFTAANNTVIGSRNMLAKYGRVVFATVVFQIPTAVTENTEILVTPYQIRYPIIINARKDGGGVSLIGTTTDNNVNIRALYGEGLSAGTYRVSFVYLTTT